MLLEPSEYWRDRLATPAYRVGEAAGYVRVSPQTVVAWHARERSRGHALLSKKLSRSGISFLQLIEMAVVADMRRSGVKLPEISRARDYFVRMTGLLYPFAQLRFKTDGADILCDDESPLHASGDDKMLAANHNGQYVWRDAISTRLKEFNYDDSGSVVRWKVAGRDSAIEIDPRVAFGSPHVKGIKTRVLKDRWVSGEEVDELSDDFSVTSQDVMEALKFEGVLAENPRLSKWQN